MKEFIDTEAIEENSFPLEEKKLGQSNEFYKNLAEDWPDDHLDKLSAYLLEAIEEDIEARKEWLDTFKRGKKLLGFKIDDQSNASFKHATTTYDTTLSTALIRFYATLKAEFFPASGPCGFEIQGESDENSLSEGAQIRDWLNNYLTKEDKGYYSDTDRFILYLGLAGSGFKKVYYENKVPISRYIMPEDFIVDADCNSILESSRLTHVLRLTKREIILKQLDKSYRDTPLPYLKSTGDENLSGGLTYDEEKLQSYSKRSLFPIYETHAYLTLEDFTSHVDKDDEKNNLPLPYIVVLDESTKKILSIRRNWEPENTLRERINYFVQYNYLPGFGIYGLGLAQLLGSNCLNLTTILRQLIDAGKFKNFPGGLRVKGFQQQRTDILSGPGEFTEVDTGGLTIEESFKTFPYDEPSAVLQSLRNEVIIQTKELASTSELGMLQSRDAQSAATTLALLENHNRIHSGVFTAFHASFNEELGMIYSLFKDNIQHELEQLNLPISNELIRIVPVANPGVNSRLEQVMRAESIFRMAKEEPALHNMPEVLKINYKALGLTDATIENILNVPEEVPEAEVLPLDPATENINMLLGKPASAAIWQNHAAHKFVHTAFAQENAGNEALASQIAAHNTEHSALEYLQQIQLMLGVDIPSQELLADPEVQNAIAMKLAEAIQLEDMTNQDSEAPAPIDPNLLIQADIAQKQAEVEARERIAAQKAETDVFKAQLGFEEAKEKIRSSEEMATLKAETELTKQREKNNGN